MKHVPGLLVVVPPATRGSRRAVSLAAQSSFNEGPTGRESGAAVCPLIFIPMNVLVFRKPQEFKINP